jgi:peptidoglycan hydrolase-like protein with peptidoglycan-binding domain
MVSEQPITEIAPSVGEFSTSFVGEIYNVEVAVTVSGFIRSMNVDYSNASPGYAHVKSVCEECNIRLTNMDQKYSVQVDMYSDFIIGFPGYPPLVGKAMAENGSRLLGPSETVNIPVTEFPETEAQEPISESDALSTTELFEKGAHIFVAFKYGSKCVSGSGKELGLGDGYGCNFNYYKNSLTPQQNPFAEANRTTQGCKIYTPNDLRPFVLCDYSEEIKNYQSLLGLPSDGYFGKGTQEAISEYQSSHGLTVTGTIDNNTAEKLVPGITGD